MPRAGITHDGWVRTTTLALRVDSWWSAFMVMYGRLYGYLNEWSSASLFEAVHNGMAYVRPHKSFAAPVAAA